MQTSEIAAATMASQFNFVRDVLAQRSIGKAMTGLPIDFQIQQQSYANEHYPGKEHTRSALGILARLRHKEDLYVC